MLFAQIVDNLLKFVLTAALFVFSVEERVAYQNHISLAGLILLTM